jgi:ADP-ribose pyrophosphatase
MGIDKERNIGELIKMDYYEETINTKQIYKGNVINIESLTVKLPDGRTATRDKVLHPGASVVIPLSAENEIFMVRQFRKAIEMVTLELPAGKLDKGEDPKDCAFRELKEETGLVAEKLEHVISIHSTPGFCDEVLHLFLATGLTEGQAETEDDEFITTEKIHVDKLVKMIHSGEITDAKTIIGVLLADRMVRGL